MSGEIIRMNRIFNASTRKSLIIKVDWEVRRQKSPISAEVVQSLKDYCDGIVLNYNQVNNLFYHFLGRYAPALIIRADWMSFPQISSASNSEEIINFLESLVENVVLTGASAIISSFLVGYERDEDEAKNVRFISLLARESEKIGLPLIVECIPFGERITRENFSRCVELAARVSTEAGADIVAIPFVGDLALLQKIIVGVGTPVLMLDIPTPFGNAIDNLTSTLNSGASGLVIGEETFARLDAQSIRKLYECVHGRCTS